MISGITGAMVQPLADPQLPERPTAAYEAELRALRTDRRQVGLVDVVATASGVGLLLAIPWLSGLSAATLLVVLPMGLLQYRLVLSGHEAVHGTLCRPAWLNEAIGTVGQALVGVSFASYRVQHLAHHRAVRPEDDPDSHIYGPILRARPGLARLLVWGLGTFAEVAVKVAQKSVGSSGGPGASAESRAASRWHSVAVIGAQLALVAVCWAATGRWWGYLDAWLLPLLGVAVLVNRSRILVEHGLAIELGVQGVRTLPTVDLGAPGWQRALLAPFGFAYHASHHLHMTVPYYNLPKLQALLRQHRAAEWREVATGYPAALRRTLMGG